MPTTSHNRIPTASPSTSLHISTIVYGRENTDGRVTYLLDPKGQGTEREIPEGVVLRRWRARKVAGYRFGGDRLPPSTFRALPFVLGEDVAAWAGLSEPAIAERQVAATERLKADHLNMPAANAILAIIAHCGVGRLQQLVERHANPDRWASPGVPDLFLYAWEVETRRVIGRFVEVKRPKKDERLSRSQVAELAFLRGLGLKARELRLIERGSVAK